MIALLQLAPPGIQPALAEVLLRVHDPGAPFAVRSQYIGAILELIDIKLNAHLRLGESHDDRTLFRKRVEKLVDSLGMDADEKRLDMLTIFLISSHIGIVPPQLWYKALRAYGDGPPE